MAAQPETLLNIENLQTYFHTDEGTVKAVDDVSLNIPRGRTLGLVGESGSGKSVTSLTIMRLLPDLFAKIEGGSISFLGKDLVRIPRNDMQSIRGSEISMIFQEPGTSLNPVYRVGDQVMETIRLHQDVSTEEARKRTIELFEEVGIPDPASRINMYPHEMSGGQKQRVMIAMALSCNPQLLIADEPTTALDVTIQAQILDLIRKLRDERGMSILFITHDLAVIAEIADEVAVMFRGKLVELADIKTIFTDPKHPYTKGLLACRPRPETKLRRLPTVSDFMDIETKKDGTLVLTERTAIKEELETRFAEGRGRLLHKKATLKEDGFDVDALSSSCGEDVAFVAADAEPLLRVEDLKVHFPVRKGFKGLRRQIEYVKAVDGISFDVFKGQTLGLVGESGCGKTTTGRSILRLVEPTAGKVTFQGKDVAQLSGDSLRDARRNMQIIFQDPYASLNPRMMIGRAITEAMEIHKIGSGKADRDKRAKKLLVEVGLLEEHFTRYPHEFSGGQRQRVGIARALSVEPELIICDESVSALDVSVQAQVLNLLKDLQEERGLTYIFISHDLSVVKFMSDMMVVMNDGLVVEHGPSDYIYANPKEDYTKRLISSIPNDSLENIEARKQERIKHEAARAKN